MMYILHMEIGIQIPIISLLVSFSWVNCDTPRAFWWLGRCNDHFYVAEMIGSPFGYRNRSCSLKDNFNSLLYNQLWWFHFWICLHACLLHGYRLSLAMNVNLLQTVYPWSCRCTQEVKLITLIYLHKMREKGTYFRYGI